MQHTYRLVCICPVGTCRAMMMAAMIEEALEKAHAKKPPQYDATISIESAGIDACEGDSADDETIRHMCGIDLYISDQRSRNVRNIKPETVTLFIVPGRVTSEELKETVRDTAWRTHIASWQTEAYDADANADEIPSPFSKGSAAYAEFIRQMQASMPGILDAIEASIAQAIAAQSSFEEKKPEPITRPGITGQPVFHSQQLELFTPA